MNFKSIKNIFLSVSSIFLVVLSAAAQRTMRSPVEMHSHTLRMRVEFNPLRYEFFVHGVKTLEAANKGILWNGSAVSGQPLNPCGSSVCMLLVHGPSGIKGELRITLTPHHAQLTFTTQDPGKSLEFITDGLKPGYGLGDDSVIHHHLSTDITGFSDDHLLADGGLVRFVSNFIIYPKQGVALVLVDPRAKIVRSSAAEIDEGVVHAESRTQMNYFFGNPHEIYAAYRELRNQDGYPVLRPKAALFGVGWESWGALGWNTSQATVLENVERYRADGYPLTWVAIGSGFWPDKKGYEATTSFGMFNHKKFPDPEELFTHFHKQGMKVLIGLRICFLVNGPYTRDGLKHGYFRMKGSNPEIYHGEWPKSPYYLLNEDNPAALHWYLDLVRKWTAYGIDGFIEDLYGYKPTDMPDDKVNLIDNALMRRGIYVIERNGYLSSDGDLIRINDFNYDQNQDRGPVNSLALAYSGNPLLFPTIVGGAFAGNKFATERTRRMDMYMMRVAQWIAVHCGMAMSEPPWTFSDPEVGKVMLKAAQLHARLQPYFYSQGVRFSKDGYPWPMTMLPIAYPHDPRVYGRGNASIRGYEWMIGDALLATPLYGNDYATATTRDVYLPKGKWMDYDTGKTYIGPLMLKNFKLPVGKTPLFVGGTGIVIEKVDGKDVARAYPVTRDASTIFYFPNTLEPDEISIFVHNWKDIKVINTTTGLSVPGHWARHAYQWSISPGNNYQLE